ncbi:hypothetical protein T310_9980 [Rasamsonia emersonii CBS 393.64]|uniref:non-specific serine/threonine protein kinase n=1 Tax=Rasamsonia emersonii (strain ATCC 16479 / CBS 393.64 / IMI 116815) TaxID=1408163 RepID=A0A0F4YEQ0_RASE3|nr:hypothetical protein T310_9980 [Rasamsonia emersonii CBS 393.64]KKA16436.1 hypothetical protein T310_9980 [Rasamsonia emersonii CBS 393.64]
MDHAVTCCRWPRMAQAKCQIISSLEKITLKYTFEYNYYACSAIPQMISRRAVASWSIPQLSLTSNFTSFSTLPRMDQFPYTSTIDAEPLHRYQKGGYHPITLGSFLNNKRYKILHKLGWGGYSTVWAARDCRLFKLQLLSSLLVK